MYIGLHVKYRLFLSDFNETFGQFFEKYISNFAKICPAGAELLQSKTNLKLTDNLTVSPDTSTLCMANPADCLEYRMRNLLE